MNFEYEPDAELSELLSAMVDGALDDVQSERLNEIVRDDDAARQFYVQYVNVHAMLQWQHGGVPVMELPLANVPLVSRSAGSSRFVGAFVAALLVMAFVLTAALMNHSDDDFAVATFVEGGSVQWEPRVVQGESDRLRAGRGSVSAGDVQLRLESGVRVALRGPVQFELLPGNQFRLERGLMRAYVPRGARGFTVVAANVLVQDLGTDFGVAVDKHEEVEVHVFSGSVRINSKHQLNTKNGAVRVNQELEIAQPQLDPSVFPQVKRERVLQTDLNFFE